MNEAGLDVEVCGSVSGCHSTHGTSITSLFFCGLQFGLLLWSPLQCSIPAGIPLESFSVCLNIN